MNIEVTGFFFSFVQNYVLSKTIVILNMVNLTRFAVIISHMGPHDNYYRSLLHAVILAVVTSILVYFSPALYSAPPIQRSGPLSKLLFRLLVATFHNYGSSVFAIDQKQIRAYYSRILPMRKGLATDLGAARLALYSFLGYSDVTNFVFKKSE